MSEEKQALRIVGDIARLRVQAGDVLVVKAACRISAETSSRLLENLKPYLPEGVRAIIIDQELTLSVLTPEDIAALAA